MLELLILKLNAMAASGHPGAASLINWLRSQTEPSELDSAGGGFALVPETLTTEEFIAEEEARNVGKLEPGTFVDVKAEEFMKAVRGEPSPLGEALLAFHKKYGAGPALQIGHGRRKVKNRAGLLVVPEVLSTEEWTAQAERHNAVAQDPSEYVDHKAEEFCKALRGIPTPLGEAILASHRRWSIRH